jgi:hypothetical protein
MAACRNWQLRTIGQGGWITQNERMGDTKPRDQLTGSILFGAFGLFLVLLSFGKNYLNYLYTLDGKETVGVVLYSGFISVANGRTQSSITYSFVLPNGQSIQSSQTGYSRKRGDSIRIQYLAAHPSFSRVAGSQALEQVWLKPLGFLGLSMMALSFHWLLSYHKRATPTA